MSTKISCPACRHEFELTDVLQEQVDAAARRQLAVELDKVRAEAAATASAAIALKDQELKAARNAVDAAKTKEAELIRRERELGEAAATQQLELQKALTIETNRIREQSKIEADARIAREIEEKLTGKNAELELARAKVVEATKKEADLLQRERALAEQAVVQALELEKRVAAEGLRVREIAKKEAEEKLALALADGLKAKDAELEAARAKSAEATARELEWLKVKRDLQEKAAAQELEVAKRVDAELEAVREKARLAAEQLAERKKMSDAEHEESRRQLEKTVQELQQRLQQGSMQIQGEVQEVELKKVLADAFRDDQLDDVAKGARGADLVQRVFTVDRRECGTIIWESKRTQTWSDLWLQKLRDDKREAGASLAVIVTQALPGHIRGFGEHEGVWICSWAYAVPVATVLRAWLAEVTTAKLAAANSETKGQRLYNYLTGQEFRNRFEGVVEAYREMRTDLEKEKRAFFSLWNKREKQLDRALKNLGAFHGDVRGISGASMQELSDFALPGASADALLGDGEEDDEAGAVLDGPLDPAITEIFLAHLPADETPIGNTTLLKKIEEAAVSRLGRPVTDAEYEAAKTALIRDGVIRKGKGRGGSVARVGG